ncbi:MAG TPA: G/U mismatch-specific DNA glycosylase [Acidimicrobiales bacterium]|nr:G/U mismatch-specific DNA glycosylase [Acidimicrobiales bacterium]
MIAPDLDVLFCGINPGLWTAAVGHHFGRPGNRFWKVLALSGFTPGLMDPSEQEKLLGLGLGITNLVSRATATAAELTAAELRAGAAELVLKVDRWRPRAVAVVGMTAYRKAFERPKAVMGLQNDRLGDARVWLLPNPSGLQARYQLPDLVKAFAEVRLAAGQAG